MSERRRAVFLDRDGLINRQAPPHQYICRTEDFILLPGVPEAIKRLNMAGYLVLVVTNQRGVARGMLSMEQLSEIHNYMNEELARHGARVDGIYVCPHNEGECDCRKPGIGLFLRAERDYPIDRARSWMVGDSDTDVQAGQTYGVRTLLTGDLPGAVREILAADAQDRAGSARANLEMGGTDAI